MPIYEYQCEDCAHEFEAIQKFSDAPLTECPQCSHLSLKKKISMIAFRLKGAGWYETDFKTGAKKNLVEGSAPSSSSSDASSSTASPAPTAAPVSAPTPATKVSGE